MAKNVKKHLVQDSRTFQAVCRKADFFGTKRNSRQEARADAAGHNAKPGCENHIVAIIETTVVVKEDAQK